MEIEELLNIYRRWYFKKEIQYEVIRFLFNRETALIAKDPKKTRSNIRMQRIHNTQHLMVVLDRYCFTQYPYNIYYSVTKFKDGIPYQSLNPMMKRDSPVNQEWKFHKYIENAESYDFVIDIDVPQHKDFKDAKEDAIKLHNFYNKLGIPHEIRFTGKGFHFVTPTPEVDLPFDPQEESNVYDIFYTLANYLYEHISSNIDLSIYDSRRVIKCPYSLSLYKERVFFVCLPILTTEQLHGCTLSSFSLATWEDSTYKLRRRGTRLFNDTGSLIPLVEYIKNDNANRHNTIVRF